MAKITRRRRSDIATTMPTGWCASKVVDANGRVVQTIEYAYDAFNRQVLKRITKDGETREYVRVWNGGQLIEEWEDGKLAKSFTYGARINEPLKMSLSSEGEPEDYFYTIERSRLGSRTD